jgi:hypothetical protein
LSAAHAVRPQVDLRDILTVVIGALNGVATGAICMDILLSAVPGLRPRRSVEGAVVCRNAGPMSLVDESSNNGQSDTHGQVQCGLVFCWQGREQHGQPVAALAPVITTQRRR